MLPTNFDTAIKAAAYITALTAYPDKGVSFTNEAKTLQIGSEGINIRSVDEMGFPAMKFYSCNIGENLTLRINRDGAFSVSGAYAHEDGLQGRIYEALGKTGFTPTTKFTLGHSRLLKAYRHLFNQGEYDKHLDQLEGAFPNQVKENIEFARTADITRVSQTYLDAKLANESCVEIPLYGATKIPLSNLKRAKKLVSNVAMAAVTGAYPRFGNNFAPLSSSLVNPLANKNVTNSENDIQLNAILEAYNIRF